MRSARAARLPEGDVVVSVLALPDEPIVLLLPVEPLADGLVVEDEPLAAGALEEELLEDGLLEDGLVVEDEPLAPIVLLLGELDEDELDELGELLDVSELVVGGVELLLLGAAVLPLEEPEAPIVPVVDLSCAFGPEVAGEPPVLGELPVAELPLLLPLAPELWAMAKPPKASAAAAARVVRVVLVALIVLNSLVEVAHGGAHRKGAGSAPAAGKFRTRP